MIESEGHDVREAKRQIALRDVEPSADRSWRAQFDGLACLIAVELFSDGIVPKPVLNRQRVGGEGPAKFPCEMLPAWR